MSRDPVAWTMIEAGWKVFDAEGDEVGTVYEVTGDAGADIFDGLAIDHGAPVRALRERRTDLRR